MKNTFVILISFSFPLCLYAETFQSSLEGKSLGVTLSKESKNRFGISFRKLKGQNDKGKPVWGAKNHIKIILNKNEVFSAFHSFYCTDDSAESYYATFNPKKISRTKPVEALRAWHIDKRNDKIVPVKKVKSITCDWVQQGDEEFPQNLIPNE